MTGKPEVIDSSVRLVPPNALVSINGVVFRIVGLSTIHPSLCIRTKSNPCDHIVFTKQGW